jgi:class 3 adenylate cyclase
MSIVFTDIHNSSKLWKIYDNIMYDALAKHDKIIRYHVKKYNGLIIKNIGDAFMIHFPIWMDSIKFAINIQDIFPIPIRHHLIELRIGIGIGQLYKKYTQIQHCKLVDYFGKTVNIASRMESKVSPINGFAVYFENPLNDAESLWNIDPDLRIKKIQFKHSCPKHKGKSILANECHISSELHGVGNLTAYSIKL